MTVENLTPMPLTKASDVLADVDDLRHVAQRVVTRLVDFITDADEHVDAAKAKVVEYETVAVKVESVKAQLSAKEKELSDVSAKVVAAEKKYADLRASVAKLRAAVEGL